MLLNNKCSMTIEKACCTLAEQDIKITAEVVQNHTVATVKAVRALPGSDLISPRRSVSINYGGSEIPNVDVTSINDEVQVRTWSMLKVLGRTSNILDRFPLEDMCIDMRKPEEWQATVEAEVLLPAVEATAKLAALLKDPASVSSGDMVQAKVSEQVPGACLEYNEYTIPYNEVAQNPLEPNKIQIPWKVHSFKRLDENFRIEQAILSMLTGEKSTQRYQQRILNCFPTADIAKKPEETAVELDQLRISEVTRLSPRSSQRLLEYITSKVACLVEDRPPELGHGAQGDLTGPSIQIHLIENGMRKGGRGVNHGPGDWWIGEVPSSKSVVCGMGKGGRGEWWIGEVPSSTALPISSG
eukprot:7786846-Lingulodinium_polyedra.AAC.1